MEHVPVLEARVEELVLEEQPKSARRKQQRKKSSPSKRRMTLDGPEEHVVVVQVGAAGLKDAAVSGEEAAAKDGVREECGELARGQESSTRGETHDAGELGEVSPTCRSRSPISVEESDVLGRTAPNASSNDDEEGKKRKKKRDTATNEGEQSGEEEEEDGKRKRKKKKKERNASEDDVVGQEKKKKKDRANKDETAAPGDDGDDDDAKKKRKSRKRAKEDDATDEKKKRKLRDSQGDAGGIVDHDKKERDSNARERGGRDSTPTKRKTADSAARKSKRRSAKGLEELSVAEEIGADQFSPPSSPTEKGRKSLPGSPRSPRSIVPRAEENDKEKGDDKERKSKRKSMTLKDIIRDATGKGERESGAKGQDARAEEDAKTKSSAPSDNSSKKIKRSTSGKILRQFSREKATERTTDRGERSAQSGSVIRFEGFDDDADHSDFNEKVGRVASLNLSKMKQRDMGGSQTSLSAREASSSDPLSPTRVVQSSTTPRGSSSGAGGGFSGIRKSLGSISRRARASTQKQRPEEEGGSPVVPAATTGSHVRLNRGDNKRMEALESAVLKTGIVQSSILSMVANALFLTGIDEEARFEILDQISQLQLARQSVERGQPIPPYLQKDGEAMYPQYAAKVKQLIACSDRLQEHQLRCEGATKIQALARGFLFRRRWAKLAKDDDGLLLQRSRLQSIQALLRKEKDYNDQLHVFHEGYYAPIKDRLPEFTSSQEDLSHLFANLPEIVACHDRLLAELENGTADWPFLNKIESTLLFLCPSFYVYQSYISNYKNAMAILGRLRSASPSFDQLVEEINDTTGTKLEALLGLPLNHLGKLLLSLEALVHNTKEGSEARSTLEKAVGVVQRQNQLLQKALLESNCSQELVSLQMRIKECPDLQVMDRAFLMETAFQVLESDAVGKMKHHTASFLLFSDALMVSEPIAKRKSTRTGILAQDSKFKEMGSLEEFEVLDVDEEGLEFSLLSPQRTYAVTATCVEEKTTWIRSYREALHNMTKNRLFGVTLQHILDAEKPANGVPSIVTECLLHVESLDPELQTKGMFRISGDQSAIEQLKMHFQSRSPSEYDLAPYDVHATTGTLKLWLRQLPEPLLSTQLYDEFIEIQRNCESEEDEVRQIRGVLDRLPPGHYAVLSHLFAFLTRLCTNCEVNMMTANNVAIVFGPSLLWPKVSSSDSALHSPLVNRSVECMLENYSTLFGTQ